jgi:hypothetical protein
MADRARRSWSRRGALALGGTLALAACTKGGVDVTSAPRPAETPIRLSTRWDAHPDGPIPAAGDDGVPITPILAGSTVNPAIVDRALVGNLPADRAAAAYVTQRLGQRVERIGARFGYDPGATSGAIALLGWTGEAVLNGHCHMVITPTRWIAGVVTANSVVEVASEDFATPLPQDGRPLRVDVQFAGSDVTLSLPDGTMKQVSDLRFAAPGGVMAGWEFYKDTAASAPVKFYETWAG